MDIIGYEYGYYNDYPKDKEYFTNLYTKRGYKNVKVKKVRSDTRGLKAYEITGIKEGVNTMKWTDYLDTDVYSRLAHCKSKKSDIEKLVNAKWSFMKKQGKDKEGFSKEDALVSVLELLDDNGQYIDLTREEYNELCEGCGKLKEEAEQVQVIKYYFPITIELEDREYDDTYDVPSSQARRYIDEIRDALEKEHTYVTPEELGEYTRIPKVQSVEFDVGTVRGDLCGIAKVAVLGELTEDEEEELIDWIEGQNSDGFGEGFEQNDIDVGDGDVINVSFWNPGRNYFIKRI